MRFSIGCVSSLTAGATLNLARGWKTLGKRFHVGLQKGSSRTVAGVVDEDGDPPVGPQHGLDLCEVLALARLAAINSTLRGVDGADAGRSAGDQRETLGILAHLSVS